MASSTPSMALPSAGTAVQVGAGVKSYAQAVDKNVETHAYKFPMRYPVDINGELGFIFSEMEMVKAEEDFRFALVMKFMRFRPSIDRIRLSVVKTWGLTEIPTISFMDDYHVLIHMKNERDFVHGWTREGRIMEGNSFRLFKWTKEFDVKKESTLAPQWIFLPGLPMHLYRMDFLQILVSHFGRYLGTDNATINRTRALGARICVEVDLTMEPVKGFPFVLSPKQCIWQEVKYEKMGFFCSKCCQEGHTSAVCRVEERRRDDEEHYGNKIWKPKVNDGVLEINTNTEIRATQMEKEAILSIVPVKEMGHDINQVLTDLPVVRDNENQELVNSDILQMSMGDKGNNISTESVEEECDEVRGDDDNRVSQGEPIFQEKVHYVDSLNQFEDGNQGLVQGYSSEREEGEISVLKDKEKMYESDTGQRLTSELNKTIEEKSNIRGLGNSSGRLKSLIKKFNVDLFAISEPFTAEDRMVRLGNLLSYHHFISNEIQGGKLWIFWKDFNAFEVTLITTQMVSGWFVKEGQRILVSFVYAKCSYAERRELWRHLEENQVLDFPWVVLGDFNVIRRDAERIGGRVSRSWAKLDRVLINNAFSSSYGSAHFKYLSRKYSDHCPMVVYTDTPFSLYGPSHFRFLNMWRSHDSFLSCVKDAWIRNDSASGLLKLAIRLKRTKVALRAWNKNVFRRVGENIQALEERMELLENQLQSGFSEEVEADYLTTKLEIQNFLFEFSEVETCDMSGLIQRQISNDDNDFLCSIPTEEEVKRAVFSIPKDSSPGPDGFGSEFYMSCWDIVKDDVMDAAVDFFQGTPLSRFYSSSFIVLIPKVDNPASFDKFRPISLCSMAYKIFSKIIVFRLTDLVEKLVSHEQGAFIPGHSIFENITLAQEMAHSLHKKVTGGNVMVKLDMAKAYDRVNWSFLLEVLKAFGFFQSARGLRQGDPLSPFLFILMEEVLTRLLRKNFESGRIGRFYHPIGAPLVSHLLYADDILIFANGGKRSIRNLVKAFETYEKWSGQRMNKDKSAIFPSKYISSARKRDLLHVTGFREGYFPVTYLGAPLVYGKLSSRILEPLVEKIRNKIVGWKFKLLSQGGRLILLRHVLSSMPIHLMSVVNVPGVTISKINSLLANFLWGEMDGRRKTHWRSWGKVCKPTSKGGLGLRDLKDVQKSLLMKFAFRLLTSNNLWSDFFRAKYCRNDHILVRKGRPTDSRFWRSMVAIIPEVVDNVKILVRGVELVGDDKTMEIVNNVTAGRRGQDISIWKPASDGTFSTSSAWEAVRRRGDNFVWKDWFWHSLLPKRISICIWKAWFMCLAVDDRVKDKGILMASACDCCVQRNQENIDHVLSVGDVAADIWRRASVVFGIPFQRVLPWKNRVTNWFYYARKSSIKGVLIGLLPCLITWCLWNRRCKARMEEVYQGADQIWRSVRVFARPGQFISWTKPPAGWIKLNCDGSCRGNPGNSGGGGVIRDCHGMAIAAFSSFFGNGMNNSAELKAIMEGIRLCKRLLHFNMINESDSRIVVDWLRKGRCSLWYLWDFWEDLVAELVGVNFMVFHQYREGNSVADFLAKEGARGKNIFYEDQLSLSRFLQGVLRIDRLGLPYFRH
ncbi:hypothetical protein EZV62_013796 [Acer yangbiense]|uniref:Reverse transcriptase domain-containing protein n=1 Tax=Acer yangbiense TaxID=1000413 RepID=A0A5C7HQ80_9ROSI|nr:hypothetical protein EZV62_013796 [Acer yangbiense]